ncbi:MAG: hypothetical protein JRJ51_05595 [Deltaproteobacteria bacterium]|nr:hypothetical protein [Deltaproteobacteria bacterium]
MIFGAPHTEATSSDRMAKQNTVTEIIFDWYRVIISSLGSDIRAFAPLGQKALVNAGGNWSMMGEIFGHHCL